MRRHLLPAVALVLALTPLTTSSQPADVDAARLRALFFQRDFESAIIDGRKLVAAAPERLELQAWYVLSLARGDRADEALDVSQRMIAASPRSGWAWMARGAALHYRGGRSAEADEATKKAFELMPTSGDAAWLRAQTLAGDPARREEAVAFADSHRARVDNAANLLTAKAYALYVMSSAVMPRDEAQKAAFDTYAEARQIDPTNVNAHFLPGTYLSSLKRGEEAYDLLKKAVALAPGARDVHRAYWTAIKAHPTLTAEQKNAEIERDLTAFLSQHGNRPGALLTASYGFQDLKQPDRQRQVEDSIVQKFYDSPEAEWALIARLREFDSQEGSKKPEYRRLLREYVARPKHYHKGLLGETYRKLFFNLVGDASVASDELLRVADGMTKYETTNVHISYVMAAIALADRKIHLDTAERIARDSIAALKKRTEESRPAYRSEQEFQDRLKSAPAIGHDAIGWVLFARGRLDDAEKERSRRTS